MNNSLEIDSVHLSFGQRKILTDIYLKCETGDIIGLIGRNGSGKSSLMKIIFGTLRAENQSVRLNGSYIRQLFKIPHGAHYLPQQGFAMNYLTFNELVTVFDLKASVGLILEIEDIRENAHQKLGTLSGGVRKLIEIMTVLYARGSFALLDEPFSYLSPALVKQVMSHLHRQAKVKGIILTDHQYENVLAVSHRPYVLTQGTLQEVKQRADLVTHAYLSA